MGKDGGKAKPLKQKKKKDDPNFMDDDEDDFKAKQKADKAAAKAMAAGLKDGKPLGTGLKKSGKK